MVLKGVSEGGVGSADACALDSMLTRTEQVMHMLAEKVMQSSQNTVSTLPAVAHRGTGRERESNRHLGHYQCRCRYTCCMCVHMCKSSVTGISSLCTFLGVKCGTLVGLSVRHVIECNLLCDD